MINQARRDILKGLAVTGACGLLSFMPRWLLAAWPKAAFATQSLREAVKSLYGTGEFQISNKIDITIPPGTETGVSLSIGIATRIAQVESIAIFVEKNPIPLAASFDFAPVTLPEIGTRIELIESSMIYAIVKAEGRLFGARKYVNIVRGACT